MFILTLFKSAAKSLNVNRWRAFLTMLGIIIGVSGVIVILSVGAGAQSLIMDQISSIGSNLVGIMPGNSGDGGAPASAMGISVTTLVNDDIDAVLNDISLGDIKAGSGYVNGVATLQWQNQIATPTFSGVSSDYPQVETMELAGGRFFTDVEDKSLARVIVLGSQIAKDIFADINPVNQKIKLKKEVFRVIGVAKERGSTFFGNQDDQVFIPLRTAQKILLGINHLNLARFNVSEGADVDYISENIKIVLRERHGITNPDEDDFTVRTQAQALDILGGITDSLKFLLAAIAAIALLVGGVGIMNIMLVSVTERTSEIGLRKAVGAKPRAIILQFLVEAMTLTVLGGVFGILVGAFISGLIALVANFLGYHWEYIVSFVSIIVSVGISGIIGIFFGLYPAVKAAKLHPVEALRYE
jgi:putative ABC transport system permease protein